MNANLKKFVVNRRRTNQVSSIVAAVLSVALLSASALNASADPLSGDDAAVGSSWMPASVNAAPDDGNAPADPAADGALDTAPSAPAEIPPVGELPEIAPPAMLQPTEPPDADIDFAGVFTSGYVIISDGALPRVGISLSAYRYDFSPVPDKASAEWYRCVDWSMSCDNYTQVGSGFSYTPVAQDLGNRLFVRVTVSKAGYTDRVVTTYTDKEVASGTLISGTVSMDGTPKVGAPIRAVPVGFSPTPTYSFTWQVCGPCGMGSSTTVGNGPTYTPTLQDAGKYLSVTVMATKDGYNPILGVSSALQLIGNGNITGGNVTVAGTAKVGSTLTATPSEFNPSDGTSYTYAWRRCNLAGCSVAVSPTVLSTYATYTPVAADIGYPLQISVTAIHQGYNDKTVTYQTSLIASATATSYPVTVNSGSVNPTGPQAPGAVIVVTANPSPQAGQIFDRWVTSGVTLSNPTLAVADFTMPSGPVTLTATYKNCTTTFSDVAHGSQFSCDIAWMVAKNMTTGYVDGTFGAARPVTREATAAFFYRHAGANHPIPAVATFTDVLRGHQYHVHIEWLNHKGITGGYTDGSFQLGNNVTREAMAAFLYRAAGRPPYTPPASPTFNDVPKTNAFYKEIEWLATQKITTGYTDGGFHPSVSVSREAMAAFLHRAHDKGLLIYP